MQALAQPRAGGEPLLRCANTGAVDRAVSAPNDVKREG
jgi:hypothetical protein